MRPASWLCPSMLVTHMHMSRHLQVKGKRLDTEGGIRTRTRARSQAEQWSSIALPLKIAILLTDAYIETTTQGATTPGVGGCLYGRGLTHLWHGRPQ